MALVLCAAFVLVSAVRAGVGIAEHLAFPYDLWAESAHLDSVRVLESGRSLYDPAVYSDVPFVLTMYTPLYFEVLAALPWSDAHPFLPGRLLSAGCLLLACASLFGVARGRPALVVAALAAASFYLIGPVLVLAASLRLDPLALALSAWAVVLARRGRAGVLLAALLSALAIATKQSHVAAALAIAIHLGLSDRRRAALFVGTWLGLLAAGAVAASLAWGRGFWFSTLVAPLNRVAVGQAVDMAVLMLRSPPFVLVELLTAWTLLRALARERMALFRRSPFAVYILVSNLVLVATVGKLGSSPYYFFEPLLAQLMWLVAELGPDPRRVLSRRGAGLALGLLLLLAAHAVASGDAYREGQSRYRPPGAWADDLYPGLRAELGAGPLRVLRLGGAHHGFGRDDVVCMNDIFLYNLLWQAHRLDVAPLQRSVEARDYDLILLPKKVPMPPPDVPGQPFVGVLRAVESGYRLAGRDQIYQYYLRSG